MPNTGTPASRSAGSKEGSPSSYTEDGPPERMSAAGSFASISATAMECGTTSLKQLASRTRRAMSWAYWAPKSTTRTGRSARRIGSPPSTTTWSSASACGVPDSGLGASLTRPRLLAGARQPALDLTGDPPLHPEREEGHATGQHDEHHLRQGPAHLEAQQRRRDEVDEVDEAVRLGPPVERVLLTLHAEAVGEHHLDDEHEQSDADDERHDLEEGEAGARAPHGVQRVDGPA